MWLLSGTIKSILGNIFSVLWASPVYPHKDQYNLFNLYFLWLCIKFKVMSILEYSQSLSYLSLPHSFCYFCLSLLFSWNEISFSVSTTQCTTSFHTSLTLSPTLASLLHRYASYIAKHLHKHVLIVDISALLLYLISSSSIHGCHYLCFQHDELVLLLIQLRRNQAGLGRAKDVHRSQMEHRRQAELEYRKQWVIWVIESLLGGTTRHTGEIGGKN